MLCLSRYTVRWSLINRKNSLFNIRPDFSFHYPQVIFRLKIQPELCLDPEVSFQSERRVSGYAPLAVYNFAYSIRRNRYIPGQLIHAYSHGFHEIFTQNFTGRNGVKKVFVAHLFTSMIIDDSHVKGITIMPFKTDSPLFIDADCILSLSIAFQRMKHVSWI